MDSPGAGRIWNIERTTGMLLDYRYHYAVLMTEERFRNLRLERSLQRRLRPLPEPRRQVSRRWSVADFVGRVMQRREAR